MRSEPSRSVRMTARASYPNCVKTETSSGVRPPRLERAPRIAMSEPGDSVTTGGALRGAVAASTAEVRTLVRLVRMSSELSKASTPDWRVCNSTRTVARNAQSRGHLPVTARSVSGRLVPVPCPGLSLGRHFQGRKGGRGRSGWPGSMAARLPARLNDVRRLSVNSQLSSPSCLSCLSRPFSPSLTYSERPRIAAGGLQLLQEGRALWVSVGVSRRHPF